MKKNRFFRSAYLLCLMMCVSATLFAGAKAELWERWTLSDESNSEQVDHSAWQGFLDTYRELDRSDSVAKIRYADVSTADKAILDRYIGGLENSDVDSLNSNEQRAFWVNLYNATTIQLILNEYPVTSIRRISEPWDKKLLSISGENVSLNDIEHRILRPRWKDARIHFVVNCASIGCPDVPEMVLSAENAESILESSARSYINHPRGVSLQGRNLIISSIFDWYKEDFGEEKEAVLEYISRYRDLEQLIDGSGRSLSNINVRYEYDWDINEP